MHCPCNQLGQLPVSFEPATRRTQWTLLAAALISGPAMIYTAMQTQPPAWLRAGMMIAGVATVGWNIAQFMQQQQVATQTAVQRELEPMA